MPSTCTAVYSLDNRQHYEYDLWNMINNMQNSINESIGDRLRRARHDRGYSQANFAATLGIPARTYMGWEYNAADPSARGLTALLKVHSIDPAWLLDGDGTLKRDDGPTKFDSERLQEVFANVLAVFRKTRRQASPEAALAIAIAIFEVPSAREVSEFKALEMYLGSVDQDEGCGND
jgi:transcriptional regulator with XRE-family HTH domain